MRATCESVMLPSSTIWSRIMATSLCAFSSSLSRITAASVCYETRSATVVNGFRGECNIWLATDSFCQLAALFKADIATGRRTDQP